MNKPRAGAQARRDFGLFAFAGTLSLFPLILIGVMMFQTSVDDWDQIFYRPTLLALKNSFSIFLLQAVFIFPLALFTGSMVALFDYPFRRLSLLISFFPLVLPSFITAIGIQSLNGFLPYEKMDWVDGFWGSVWTGVSVGFPLAAIGTFLAVRFISKSELEVAAQVGGKLLLFKCALRRALPSTLACVCLAGLIEISDFGVSNIMGFHGIASEIQISFARKFDYTLAAAKSVFFSISVLPAFVFVLWRVSKPVIAGQNLSQGSCAQALPFWLGSLWSVVQICICSLATLAILTGLLRPLLRPNSLTYFKMVWKRYLESLDLTLFYSLGSGLLATLLGFMVASYFFSRQSRLLKMSMLSLTLLCFVLPSSITALGVTWLGSQLPRSFDFLFRSEWTVVLTMGVRFAPIAILLFAWGYSLLPKGLSEVHQVIKPNWLFSKCRLQFFALWKWGALSLLITSILTLADVGAHTLVQPPTSNSFGAYFFGSMDNTPEVLVSSMCIVYMFAPFMILTVGGFFYKVSQLSKKLR